MLSDERPIGHWWRHPIYKYGMLVFFAFFATHYVRRLVTGGDESARVGYQIGLVSVALMLTSHISLAFLQPAQQRRVAPFHVTFMIACLGYVFVQLWQQPF